MSDINHKRLRLCVDTLEGYPLGADGRQAAKELREFVYEVLPKLESENAKLYNAMAQLLTLHEPCIFIPIDRQAEILSAARTALKGDKC